MDKGRPPTVLEVIALAIVALGFLGYIYIVAH